MTRLDSRLIAPPEKEEIYPYRRAWRSVVVESSVMFAITALIFVLLNYLGLAIPQRVYRPLNLGLTLLPILLWVIFSWSQERRVQEPRQRLMSVLLLSALVANAIGYPLVNEFFRVDRWLPLENAVNRIVGYAFTIGITQELLKYLVLRALVWPDHFNTWLDGIAYSAAAAIGYATVLNLHFVLSTDASPDVAAVRIFGTYAVHLATSLLMGYALSDLRFSGSSLLFLPLSLALSAFIAGIAIPVRSGLVNASLSPDALELSLSRPILGIGFSAAILVALMLVLSFLFRIAERRQREAQESREA